MEKNGFLKFLFLLLCPLLLVGCGDDDDKTIDSSGLPIVASLYISEYLGSYEYDNVTKYKKADANGRLYSVELSKKEEFITLDFDANGNWLKIKSGSEGLPSNIIRSANGKILAYMDDRDADLAILEMEKKYYGYRIVLNNNEDLAFSTEGNYLGSDKGIASNQSVLPDNTRKFISDHFGANAKINLVTDEEDNLETYKVYFENGFFVYFDSRGEWELISSNNYNIELPESIQITFPADLQKYVDENYSKYKIIYIEKQEDKYQLKLIPTQGLAGNVIGFEWSETL